MGEVVGKKEAKTHVLGKVNSQTTEKKEKGVWEGSKTEK